MLWFSVRLYFFEVLAVNRTFSKTHHLWGTARLKMCFGDRGLYEVVNLLPTQKFPATALNKPKIKVNIDKESKGLLKQPEAEPTAGAHWWHTGAN